MEKPDRDYTHAMRAEDEYRAMIQQYPDHKLIPEAKQRLREVQEVLAERQYRIGRFYYLRESFPAAIARLKTLADTYPLYSQADDALMMLGRSYEAEAGLLKSSKVPEIPKVRLIKQYDADAGKAYARLIERYPTSDRAADATARLKDLGLPVPTPTPQAIAQNKAEEESRSELGRFGKMMSNFHKAPDDLPRAAKVGEPTLVDPQPTSAPQLIREANNAALGIANTGGNGTVSVEKATDSDVKKSDPIPRSEPATANPNSPAAPASNGTGSDTGIGELTPNAASAPPSGNASSNSSADTSGSTATAAPPPAPAQLNEIQNGSSGDAAGQSQSPTSTNDQASSSSKKKKKKGLKKIVPF